MTDKEKPTLCIACEKPLRCFSLMICSECLNDECGKFAILVSEQPVLDLSQEDE